MSVADWAGVAGVIVAAGAAGMAWRAANRSATAAETLARIEQQRDHRELTPKLRVEAAPLNPGSSLIRLTIQLDGPDGLDRLDEVRVRVLDDRVRHAADLPKGPTQAEIDATVWGPCRFTPGADGADEHGRTVSAFPLIQGESHRLQMEPSPAPSWMFDMQQWRRDYDGTPIRLEFTCVRNGYEPWRIPVEVVAPSL